MCRNIKRLRQGDQPVGDEEIREAALQFVRKISGFNRPSQRQAVAFYTAVDEVAASSRRLLRSVTVELQGKTA